MWSTRRKAGLVSQAVEIGSDRSFGVFLVHPMVLWALTLGLSAWLSTHMSALCSTIVTMITTAVVSLLVVEMMRHSLLSTMLTGKRHSRRGSPGHSHKSEFAVSAPPIRLGPSQAWFRANIRRRS